MVEHSRLEEIIVQLGGCGRYQVTLSLIVHSMKAVVCFSMVAMSFGSAVPDWWCVDDAADENLSAIPVNTTAVRNLSAIIGNVTASQYKSCSSGNGSHVCSRFVYDDSMTTVVTQWDLLCGQAWVPSTITSIQMAGVLVGNVVCGHLADLIGRKPPLFIAMTMLLVCNGISTVCTSWPMFAVVRFFIGLGMGFELTVQYTIQSEFTLARWRSWVVAVPSWSIHLAIFALVCWLTRDWRIIHLVTAAMAIPCLLSWWLVPESFRWYVANGRITEARKVIKRIAKVNKRPMPDLDEIASVAEAETTDCNRKQQMDRKYSIIDIFRTRRMLTTTLLLLWTWMTLGLAAYGIQFGVHNLSGDLYLNLFLLGAFNIPTSMLCIYLNNRIGRKKNAITWFLISCIAAFLVGIAQRLSDVSLKNRLTNISAMVSLIAINTGWSPVQVLTVESYPTVVRNIGFGIQNTMARVGAMIGPQLVFLDMTVPGLMYFLCGAAAVVSIVTILFLRETGKSDLSDRIGENSEERDGHVINAAV